MLIKLFAFLVETFQFSKVDENKSKHGKCYNERNLSKNWYEILQAHIFVVKQPNYLEIL